MRIISGTLKKHKLISPKMKVSPTIRPTSDRIKETLFNLLGDITGVYFLDLFAGTGNIGIEALSRGARYVYFVEKSGYFCNIIKKNLSATNLTEQAKVINKKVSNGLFNRFKEENITFDIIFADPPYGKGILNELNNILDYDILKEKGIFVYQHSVREKIEGSANRSVKIGDSLLSLFYRKKGK